MKNNRPIENAKLQAALDEVKTVMARYELAGACMLVSADEAAFTYGMHAPWSALRPDASLPLGFRFRAKSAEDGHAVTRARVEAAMHTICQLHDFGTQTVQWMGDLERMLRQAGIDFEHTPFGGAELPHLDALTSSEQPR